MQLIARKKAESVIHNIRAIREHKQYSQRYLAGKLSLSQNAYSKLELGQSALTVERLFALSMIFDMEVTDVIYYQPTAERATL